MALQLPEGRVYSVCLGRCSATVSGTLYPTKAQLAVPLAHKCCGGRKGDWTCIAALRPHRARPFAATHSIHTPAAIFRGWMVTQLKSPEMAQASKQKTWAGVSGVCGRACRRLPGQALRTHGAPFRRSALGFPSASHHHLRQRRVTQ